MHSILRHVAEMENESLLGLYERFGWPLYQKYGHAIAAFKQAVTDPSVFDGFDIPANILKTLLVNIKRRLAPQVRW